MLKGGFLLEDKVKFYLSKFLVRNEYYYNEDIKPIDLKCIFDDFSVKYTHYCYDNFMLLEYFKNRDNLKEGRKLADFLLELGGMTASYIRTGLNVTSEQLKKFIDDSYQVYKRKQHDYGDSYSRTVDNYGVSVIFVRLSDKINRLYTLTNSSNIKVSDESLLDTAIDLLNYTAMALNYMTQKFNFVF